MKLSHLAVLIAFLTLLVALASLGVAVHQWNEEVGGV